MNLTKTKNIKISELTVSTINPRFVNIVLDEKQAIINLIKYDTGKMINLVKSIKEKGVLPIPFYILKENNGYTVMDGNRRLSAIKIIKDNTLLPQDGSCEELLNLCKSFSVNEVEEVPCIVFEEYNDGIFDVLTSLHIEDESKLIWTPLAQYNMSRKMGGNKYKWMNSLLYYFPIEEVDKKTVNKADAFNRLFSAISTRKIKIKATGEIDLPNIKECFMDLVKLVDSKILNTRTPQNVYENKVEEYLLKEKTNEVEIKKYFLKIIPDVIYKDQIIPFSKLKISVVDESGINVNINKEEINISFCSPEGNECAYIDTSILGQWKVSAKYCEEMFEGAIEVINKVNPEIKFVNSVSKIQFGETANLTKFIESARNSFNENVINKIKTYSNFQVDSDSQIKNNTFLQTNPQGIYQIRYEFKDVDGTPFSKVYTIEVDDFKSKTIQAEKKLDIPLRFETNVTININPIVNDLINEIQSLNFYEHTGVITCSIRSVLELTLDELERRNKITHQNNLLNRLNDLISHLKSVAVNYICKNNKSTIFKSYHTLTNTLSIIDINKINALINLGAHKSKQIINETTFKEILNKDIVNILVIVSEYIK